MDFDNYYQQRDAHQNQEMEEVKQYNLWVDILTQAIPMLIEQYTKAPPEFYDWVNCTGVRCVSWPIYKEYDDDYRINLLPDGTLVKVQGGTFLGHKLRPVTQLVQLRHISSRRDRRDISHTDLSRVCSTIVTELHSAPKEWHQALLGNKPTYRENWGRLQ